MDTPLTGDVDPALHSIFHPQSSCFLPSFLTDLPVETPDILFNPNFHADTLHSADERTTSSRNKRTRQPSDLTAPYFRTFSDTTQSLDIPTEWLPSYEQPLNTPSFSKQDSAVTDGRSETSKHVNDQSSHSGDKDTTVVKRQKHQQSDRRRRARMRQEVNRLRKLLCPDDIRERVDGSTVVGAGADAVESLTDQVARLTSELEYLRQAHRRQEAQALYAFSPLYATLAVDDGLDALGVSLKRCTLSQKVLAMNRVHEKMAGYRGHQLVTPERRYDMGQTSVDLMIVDTQYEEEFVASFRQRRLKTLALQDMRQRASIELEDDNGKVIAPSNDDLVDLYASTICQYCTPQVDCNQLFKVLARLPKVLVFSIFRKPDGASVEALMSLTCVSTQGQEPHLLWLSTEADRRYVPAAPRRCL